MRGALAGAGLLLFVACAAGTTAAPVSASPAGQLPAPGDSRALAGRLLAGGASRDTAVREAGFEAAVSALWALVGAGQEPTATIDAWRDLHLALDALADLHEARGDLLKASLYATLQDIQYRNLDDDWAAALTAAERALALQQRSGVAVGLFLKWKAVGECLLHLGRADEALPRLRTAQQLLDDPYRTLAAVLWRTIIQAEGLLGNTAAVEAELARFDAAAVAGPPVYRGQALLSRADVLIDRGRYGDALTMAARARAAVNGDPGATTFEYEVAAQLFTCVLASMRSLSYDDALALSRRISTEFPDLLIAVEPAAAAAIRLRRRMAGQFDVVLREDAERLAQCKASGNAACQVEAWRSMAATYHAANASSLRVSALEAAVELERPQAEGDAARASVVSQDAWLALRTSLGWAYLDNGNIIKARREFDAVRGALRGVERASARAALRDRGADADAGLARVEELDGNIDEARSLLERQLAPEAGQTGTGRMDLWLQIARLERDAGRPADAARAYVEIITEARRLRRHHRELVVRLERARYLASLNHARVPDALVLAAADVEESERLQRLVTSSDAAWRILFIKGVLAERRSDPKAAALLYRAAIDVLDTVRRELGQQDLRESLIDSEAVQELYRRAVAVFLALDDRDRAWEFLERGRARSFLESLRGRRFGGPTPAAGGAAVEGLEKQILDVRLQLTPENRSMLRAAGRDAGVLQEQLQKLEGQLTLLRQQPPADGNRRATPLSLAVLSTDRARAALPPHSALVSYAILPDRIAAYVITRDRVDVVWSTVDPAAARKSVKRLRQLLADPSSGDELGTTLSEVSAALVAPVVPVLPPGTTRLVIVPALWMTYLPFEVLSRPDGALLTDAYVISYLPSASTLAWLSGRDAPSPSAKASLFIGAIGGRTVEGWAPLPGTLTEAAAISKTSPAATAAIEDAFTRARVLQALESFDHVHLATHGLFEDAAPLFSGVLVNGAPADPTRVTLYDVMDRRVRSSLVVLSACETGLGRLLYGDEVTGLTRTFLIAGAETVVSSLWMVADDSTAMLMARFHERLAAGDAPSVAMRAAAAHVRRTFAHPFYWAPFVVTGRF